MWPHAHNQFHVFHLKALEAALSFVCEFNIVLSLEVNRTEAFLTTFCE